MANRFWRGGAGNWSDTAKWSDTSGGAGGFSVPTSADDAIFDANSGGKFTATVDTAQSVNSLTITPSAGAGLLQIALTASLTTGNLTTTGTAGNNRIWFRSTTYGLSVDFIVNGTVSISDCDFRGIYVRGTSAPISGTRIGNRGECRNITFNMQKVVYWNLAGPQNWSANGWSDTPAGLPNTNYFPLPQDIATFTNAGSVTGTITLDAAIGYVPTVDMSGRSSAMTLGLSTATTVYGDWKNGSGTGFTGSTLLSFSGGNTQTITCAGITFFNSIAVDTYGGSVELTDPLLIGGAQTLTLTNGTFNTKNFNVSAGGFSSSNSNVRTLNLGSSTCTFSTVNAATTTNLTINAGTSQLNVASTFQFGGAFTFYNLTFTATVTTFTGNHTFTNLTFNAPAATGITACSIGGTFIVTGTLTCAGASAIRRVFLRSDTIGTQRTLQVSSISATDCDFRDIALTGAASGASPTRAGNCGGNLGISFSTKTVYWNLAGAQNWSATGWVTSSGGLLPDVNNFPLAQDTAVFDNAGSVTGTITINANWNIGTFDASSRSSAMTLTTSTNSPVVYGDWKFGTGVTSSSTTGTITFTKNGTQTITSNGVQFGCPVTFNHPSGTGQLADPISLNSARQLTVSGNGTTFDAVTYNVTVGSYSGSAIGGIVTTKMGSGTWTISGTGTVWNVSNGAPVVIAGTATIVLSDTSATARAFSTSSNLYYNKLTIGGTTGSSTTTIGPATFGELASTKTVAHTIIFSSGIATTIGKWAVTGTVGNVVTVNSETAGAAFTLSIAGPANSGIDYLSIRDCTVATTSPGEFYVGVNSTNVSGNTRVIFTATPAPRTLYWRGGTGNWSDTTKWDTVSGGPGPAAIPTSADAVNFNSLSNATAYSVTIDAGVTLARCAAFSMAGPAVGNVTFAGTVGIAFHGSVLFAASGITRSYTGAMNWAGNSSYTFNTNGLTFASSATVTGIGATWTLGFNTDISISTFTVTYGTFSTSASNYNLTAGQFLSNNSNVRTISLNGSTLTLSSSGPIAFTTATNLTFNSGSSSITMNASAPSFDGGGQTFYNVTFNNPSGLNASITGANTFNNLTFSGRTTVGINASTFAANQTITGTLTVSAGTGSAYRNFLASNTLNTPRTLSCAAVSLTDVDFRDIAITGVTASGTRLGNCQGTSGISFPMPKTVYWAVAGGGNWGATGNGSWTDVSGNPAVITQFPLPQDTAYIPFAIPNDNATITVNASYNIGTIDMNERNLSARVTLATGTTTPAIYGDWINGEGTTLSGTGRITYAGRGAQTIRSEGKTFFQTTTINSLGGSVTLQGAWVTNAGTTNSNPELLAGTFDANGYNVTNAGTGTFSAFSSTGTLVRTIAIGSGTWTFPGGGTMWSVSGSNVTVTGTGTISLTSASAKNFTGGGIPYSGITLNQGGAGTLTIGGNNTFKTITNTYSATGATSIALGTSTQTLTDPWTATGAATRVLTISGTSAASPATLIYTGAGFAASAVDYLSISNVRAYDIFNKWYAGANSTNGGSLGWYFISQGGAVYAATITETGTGTDSVVGGLRYLGTISELGTASDTISARSTLGTAILESATIADTNLARLIARATISETATGTDAVSARATFLANVAESTTITDLITSIKGFFAIIAESAAASDTVSARQTFNRTISESAAAADIVQAFFIAAAQINEFATGTDAISALRTLAATVAEAAAITDAAFAVAAFAARISETSAASDAVLVAPSVFNAIAVAAATAIDNFNPAGSIYRVTVPESATLSDSLIGAYLWNDINDGQTPNWGPINDGQTPGWTDINDSQPPGWQNIQT